MSDSPLPNMVTLGLAACIILFVAFLYFFDRMRSRDQQTKLVRFSNGIIEGSSAFIVVLDKNRRIVTANNSLLTARKLSLENLIGITPEKAGLISADSFWKAVKEAVDQGKTITETIQERITTKPDMNLSVDWQVSIVKNFGGKTIRYILSGLDVTELENTRKKLEEQREATERHERRVLAEELHDDIGGYLIISQMKLEELREFDLSPEVEATFCALQETIDKILIQTRSLVFELCPISMPGIGLKNTLESLAWHLQGRSGIPIRFNDLGLTDNPVDEVAYFLFKSTREIMINAIKHAQASEIVMNVNQDANKIYIDIADNGIGFDFREVQLRNFEQGGFGLKNLMDRCGFYGCSITLEPNNDSGSRFNIQAPFDHKED